MIVNNQILELSKKIEKTRIQWWMGHLERDVIDELYNKKSRSFCITTRYIVV
jgi:hypothetical protein